MLLFLPRRKIHGHRSRPYHQRLRRHPRRPPGRELHSAKRTNHLPPSITTASEEKTCAFQMVANATDAESALTALAPLRSIGSQTGYGWLSQGAGNIGFFGLPQVLLRTSVRGRERYAVNGGEVDYRLVRSPESSRLGRVTESTQPGPSRSPGRYYMGSRDSQTSGWDLDILDSSPILFCVCLGEPHMGFNDYYMG